MAGIVKITRRAFLRDAGIGAGALVFSWRLPRGIAERVQLHDLVSIEPDGTIRLVVRRAEMGQGNRSTLAAVLADELDVDVGRVAVTQNVSNDAVPFIDDYRPTRLLGASIRLLFERAAKKAGVAVDYGDARLLRRVKSEPLPNAAEAEKALKKPNQWRYIGTNNIPLIDGNDIVTGKAIYGADVPAKWIAVIARCPVANGRLRSYDATAALAIRGVRHVTPVLPKNSGGGVGEAFLPHAGVAVLADSTWAALRGREALKIEWDIEGSPAAFHADYDSDRFRKELDASVAQPGRVVMERGVVAQAHSFVADYYIPHLAQAPMEPPVATTAADGTLIGGSFGRKENRDYAVEAEFLAKQFPDVAIRVQWTREDDMRFGYYGAVSQQHCEATLDSSGYPTSFLQRSAFSSRMATLYPHPSPLHSTEENEAFAHNGYPYGSADEFAEGLANIPFAIENVRVENCPAESHIRVGRMRGGANVHHAFATCSFIDELAIAAGRNPKEYLLALLKNAPRLRAVVARSRWRKGSGIAAHTTGDTRVATVVNVSVNDRNELTINEVRAVVDCGFAVNVDRVIAQIEGGINYGLSVALFGEIRVRDGAVVERNFDDYPVLRMQQAPRIEVVILESNEAPASVSDAAVPPVIPALANAIVAAGGPRIREIPFRKFVRIA